MVGRFERVARATRGMEREKLRIMSVVSEKTRDAYEPLDFSRSMKPACKAGKRPVLPLRTPRLCGLCDL